MRLFKFRRDPTDPVDRLDRVWHHRRFRLIAGLHLNETFETLTGVVARAHGEGKYLRFQTLTEAQSALRPELSSACRRFAADGGSVIDFELIKNDLAGVQAELLRGLRAHCGSSGESILATCVADPGLWSRDFDGRLVYSSFCNPELLGSVSGVSVIDALPAKDLVAGGHGWPLTPLACWLIAADRSSPVAQHARLVARIDREIELFFLPRSDGLDDEYPAIRHERIVFPVDHRCSADDAGWRRLLESVETEPSHGEQADLFEAWTRTANALRGCPSIGRVSYELAKCIEMFNGRGWTDAQRNSAARQWVDQRLRSFVRDCGANESPALQVVLACSPELIPQAARWFSRAVPEATVFPSDELGIQADYFAATLVAALGAMHVDQMPATLPWLTRAEAPRILGRLTPGSPKQWRILLREMADYHPAAMRLRDAI